MYNLAQLRHLGVDLEEMLLQIRHSNLISAHQTGLQNQLLEWVPDVEEITALKEHMNNWLRIQVFKLV